MDISIIQINHTSDFGSKKYNKFFYKQTYRYKYNSNKSHICLSYKIKILCARSVMDNATDF